jgi:hypothetical protein
MPNNTPIRDIETLRVLATGALDANCRLFPLLTVAKTMAMMADKSPGGRSCSRVLHPHREEETRYRG